MLDEFLGRLAAETGHDFEPGAPFGDSLDPSTDLAIFGKGAAGPGRGEVNAQGLSHVNRRSSQVPEHGPELMGEGCSGRHDMNFCGDKPNLNLVLDEVVKFLNNLN